ncbi:methionine--tRNA ligase [Candidatus Peregrinibacteria bacterium]|nr:methionine--tRNA ligase [Candidatus Peregrinibacteria bacterium]
MSKSNKFYITTSIPYLNAGPHMGHTMEYLQADILARYNRLDGREVFFLTGSDEHGSKIAQVAEARGVWPQELVNENAAIFQDLLVRLGISNDAFIRTTDDKHVKFALEMWQKLVDAGDIYKANYEGLYCVGCEKFLTEKELVDGNCPIHHKPPIKVMEENYFFRLSKYGQTIREKISSDEIKVIPESRKNEILSFLEEDLTDISFSRSREAVKWCIEIPGEPDQLMYVWCDALTNYMSGVDREKFWPADIHLIGKDILRFHAVYWIGMLLSAKLTLPKVIMVHGFITSDGQKMSKSLGNVKDPFEYLEKYGRDALRYFLLREIPTLGDGDFSAERFEIVYGDELANTFGNLVSRVLAMNKKYFDGRVPERGGDDGFEVMVGQAWVNLEKRFAEYDLKKALEEILALGYAANKYVEDSKPWALAKEDQTKLATVIYNLLELIRQIGLMLLPFIPDTASKVLKSFDGDFVADGYLWAGQRDFGLLKSGTEITAAEILFPRLETAK